GSATLNAYITVLKTITYSNSSNNPTIAPRAITFVANDGTSSGAAATTTVTITAVNDAPVLDLDANDSSGATGANFTANFAEGGGPAPVADAADAILTDPDSANLVSLTVQITNLQDGASEVLNAN